jgi:hypothetical protein
MATKSSVPFPAKAATSTRKSPRTPANPRIDLSTPDSRTRTSPRLAEKKELMKSAEKDVKPKNLSKNCSDGEQYSWDEFTKQGETIRIKGKLFKEFNAKDLRQVATRLKLSPGDKKRHELVQLLSDGLMNRESYKKLDTLTTQSEQSKNENDAESLSRKKPGDLFRLLNVLYDDKFWTRWMETGLKPDRQAMDTPGELKHDNFWQNVRFNYSDESETRWGMIHFSSEKFSLPKESNLLPR